MSETDERPRIHPWSIWLIFAIMAGGVLVTFNYVKRNEMEAESARPPYLNKLKEFEATNYDGRQVQLSELEGKIWIGSYLFADCPMGCSAVASKLLEVREAFPEAKDRLHFVSISVDPESDTEENVRDFLENLGAGGDDWWYLTGPAEELRKFVTQKLLLNPARKVTDAPAEGGVPVIEHDLRVVLVDHQGHVRGYYALLDEHFGEANYEKLIRDIRYILENEMTDES